MFTKRLEIESILLILLGGVMGILAVLIAAIDVNLS